MREESFDCDKVGAEGNTSRTPKWVEKQNRRLHCHASHRRQSQNHHHRHSTHSSHEQCGVSIARLSQAWITSSKKFHEAFDENEIRESSGVSLS
jgi:hypothetical protein